MYFNKMALLFLFSVLIQNNFFAMIQIVNPDTAHTAFYFLKEMYSNCENQHEKFSDFNTFIHASEVKHGPEVPEVKDEYYILQGKKYKEDIDKLKEQKIETGDNIPSFKMIAQTYMKKENDLSDDFKEKFKSINAYSPLNFKNIFLFGPSKPLIEWVTFKIFKNSPTKIVSDYVFSKYIEKEKKLGEYIYVGILLYSGIFAAYVSLMYFVPDFIVQNALPLFLSFSEEHGIKIQISSKYTRLLTQGIVGEILHIMKKRAY